MHIIIGASSGIGLEIAEELSIKKKDLILISTDDRDLKVIAKDLTIRFGNKISYKALKLEDKFIGGKFFKIIKSKKNIEAIYFVAGKNIIDDYPAFNKNIENELHIFDVNFFSVIRIINKINLQFLKNKKINLVFFGSVTAKFGTYDKAIYASSKRALESFFESLCSFSSKNFFLQFYILGEIKTNMVFDKKNRILSPVSPNKVAKTVLKNLNKNSYVAYYPKWWWLIKLFLNLIPFKFRYLFIRKFNN